MASSVPSSISAPSIASPNKKNPHEDDVEKKRVKSISVPTLNLGIFDSTKVVYGTTPRNGDNVKLKLYTYDRFKFDIAKPDKALRIYFKRFTPTLEEESALTLLSPRHKEYQGNLPPVVPKMIEHMKSRYCFQECLSLIGCELEPKIFKNLSEGVFSSKYVTSFQIENVKIINLEIFKTLEKVMAFGESYMRNLKFVSVAFTPTAFFHIIQGVIGQNTKDEDKAITELCFEDCNLDNISEESLEEMPTANTFQTPHYAELLYSLILHSKHLKKLNLNGNHLGANPAPQLKQTPRTPKTPRTPRTPITPRNLTPSTPVGHESPKIKGQFLRQSSSSVGSRERSSSVEPQDSPKLSHSPRISSIKHQALNNPTSSEGKSLVSKAIQLIAEALKVNRKLENLMLCSNRVSLGDYKVLQSVIEERKLTDALKDKTGEPPHRKRKILINLWGNSLQDQRDSDELVTKGYSPRSEVSPPSDEKVQEAPGRIQNTPRDYEEQDAILETPRLPQSSRTRRYSIHTIANPKKQ